MSLLLLFLPSKITATKTHTTDANKRKADTKTHTTDSNKRKATTLTHTTDSFKRIAVALVHTTDANKRKAITVAHTTDANKKKATTVTHTTDANKRKVATVEHTTDTFKRIAYIKTYTADANKRKATTLTHTTDANKRKGITVEHTTDTFASTLPVVTTQDVTEINKTTATGNGNVTSDGGLTITERGIVLSTVANPTVADTKFAAAGTTGAFTAALTGLTAGVTYHVRAFGTNSRGTSYGADATFTAIKDIRDVQKEYRYEIYDNNTKLGDLENVAPDFTYSQNINSVGAQVQVTVGQLADTPGESLIGGTNANNLIQNGNRVKIYEFSNYHVNGILVFEGRINKWSANYVNDTVTFVAFSDGFELDNYIIQGAGEVADVQQTSGASSIEVYQTSSDYKYAGSTFRTSTGIVILSSLTIRCNSQGSTIPVTIKVYSAVNGTLLGTSSRDITSNAATDEDFVFSPTITTTALTTYFFAVETSLNAGTLLVYYGGSNPYANGAMYVKKYNGGFNSQTLSPTIGADNSAVGTISWATDGNVLASDDTYAIASGVGGGTTHYIKVSSFGFTVPTYDAGTTINGIKVEVERKSNLDTAGDHTTDSRVHIVKADGTVGTTDKADGATYWPTADAYKTYGGTSDLWGETWTYADMNDVDFGMVISAFMTSSNVTARIDHIRITVYYTPNSDWVVAPTEDVSAASDLYFKTWTSGDSVEFEYTAEDPADVLLDLMDRYEASGGSIIAIAANLEDTGVSADYTFKLNTAYEAIKKCLELSPVGWYWYVDIASKYLFFKNTSATATYTLIKGKHIEMLELSASIESVINDMYFSGGPTAGVNLFKHYNDATSISDFGIRLTRKSDNKVTAAAPANLLGNSFIDTNKDEKYQTEVTVLDGTIDITQFKVGQTIGFAGFQNFVDTLILQIVRIEYSPDKIKLSLGALPPRVNLVVEQLKRDLEAEQTLSNPSAPT